MDKSGHSHIGRYLAVFGGLMLLTCATVGVSYMHLGVIGAVVVAMIIAATKGSLVAAYFMHLIGENRWIYIVLAITVFFFLFLLIVPMLVSVSDYQIRN